MKENIAAFLRQQKIAVVGASNDRSKYGNIVFRKLNQSGYKVFPVNPNALSVEGQPCYRALPDLPEEVDGIVLVVPPAVTEVIVREAIKGGIRHIWMQPGAESMEAVDFCTQQGIECIYQKCILMELNK
ncbi:MAG: CoA-binding protein [Peptococcaceae bacterium]|nr:CoA-binding protein [Peptococcaceae bacterium]